MWPPPGLDWLKLGMLPEVYLTLLPDGLGAASGVLGVLSALLIGLADQLFTVGLGRAVGPGYFDLQGGGRMFAWPV